MTPAWAQRREALLSDCLVSPDIFQQMLDRLGAFVVPYHGSSPQKSPRISNIIQYFN
jgi:hypothetical protein